MKLSFELKLEIYEKHLSGYSLTSLATEYHLASTTVRHLCNLADQHGPDILKRRKKKTYSDLFKLNAINRVLIGHESSKSVAVDLGLSSNATVALWIKSYIENGYNVVSKKKAWVNIIPKMLA